MPTERIKLYPEPPSKFKDISGVREYLMSLKRALSEESVDRLQDFDILQLSNVPWVDVRDYGAKGDGTTDDTASIQAALDSLKVNGGSYNKSNQYKYSQIKGGGVLYFPANYIFRISSPLLFESDNSDTSNRIFADRIILWGYGASLKALPTFTGIDRYYDATHTETINAMILIGPKSWGKFGGQLQSYNGIYGLTFDGVDVSSIDLTAIRGDVIVYPVIKDCIFADLHKAIDGRVIRLSTVSNCKCTFVNSLYCAINDSESLGWNEGAGLDSGGPIISNILMHFTKNLTYESKYTSLGKIHLINVGEELVENVKILEGGGKGIYKEYNASTHQHYRWGRYSNIEITGMNYHAIHIKNFEELQFANIFLIHNQAQGNDASTRPIIWLENVKRMSFSNLKINQMPSPTVYKSSSLIYLQGGGCKFTNLEAFGVPSDNNLYACVLVEDGSTRSGDYNIFNNFDIGNLYYSSGNKYKYGIQEVSGVDFNIYSNGVISNCYTADLALTGTSSSVKNINPPIVNYGASTPITVNVRECYGATLTNANATGSIHFDLPVATVGMNITFFNTVAQTIVIDPNGTDQIMVITNTSGDTITSDGVIGTYIALECLAANKWYVKDYAGVWTEE